MAAMLAAALPGCQGQDAAGGRAGAAPNQPAAEADRAAADEATTATNAPGPAEGGGLRRDGATVISAWGYDKGKSVAWYRLPVGQSELSNGVDWSKVKLPEGTACAYTGKFGDLDWCEWQRSPGEIAHLHCMGVGIDFDKRVFPVPQPGEKKVVIRYWVHDRWGKVTVDGRPVEIPKDSTRTFDRESVYLFCFNKVVESDGRSQLPAANLEDLIGSLVAVVEVVRDAELQGK